MASMIQVIGAKEIKAKLREVGVKYAWRARKGLLKGGLLLQRLSQEIVPVGETGNLKNSAGTRAIGHGFSTDVIVYYTAEYAVYVHENTMAHHGATYNMRYPDRPNRGANQQAKFLETPARVHREEILRVIAGELAKVVADVKSAPTPSVVGG